MNSSRILLAFVVVISVGLIGFGLFSYYNGNMIPQTQVEESQSVQINIETEQEEDEIISLIYTSQVDEISTEYNEYEAELNLLLADGVKLRDDVQVQQQVFERIDKVTALKPKLNTINPTEELKPFHKIWKPAKLKQLESYKLLKTAIQNKDAEQMLAAADLLEEANAEVAAAAQLLNK